MSSRGTIGESGTNPNSLLVNEETNDQFTATERYIAAGKFPEAWHRSREYGTRPFICWDGEGITYDGDTVQSYVLFGCSAGRRVLSASLSTEECLDLLIRTEEEFPEAIHVGFALQYDWNMIFRDIPVKALHVLYKKNRVRWKNYKIEYRPGKWTTITRGKTTIRVFDVFGFFQSSFVAALERFLGETAELDQIRAGKEQRKTFEFSELRSLIIPYWEAELRLMVRLMDSLRDDLDRAGIRIRSWHGPGAVASTVFRAQNIQLAKGEPPREVNRAAQYAYAGGRFELFRCGHHPGKVYEYDINSAYPAAIAELPNLADGRWERVNEFDPTAFGVWYCQYSYTDRDRFWVPHPLFCRNSHGHVTFQDLVSGWYWTPEASLVPDSVQGGYIFRHNGSAPFAFVRDMYAQRKKWKAEGNSAERAYKLALNSLYGKMAQRVGWLEGRPLPRWHQLEWAGYVTSATRAKLWQAIAQSPKNIVAVETDAVFSLVPLDLPTSSALGDWELEEFDWITYVQNGVYWGGKDGKTIEKYRGYDKGSLDYSEIWDYLANPTGRNLTGRTTRFIGMGLGLHTSATWRSWQVSERNLVLGGGGKRQHLPLLCPSCKAGIPLTESLHPLACTSGLGRSHPHSLPWMVGKESILREIDEMEKW